VEDAMTRQFVAWKPILGAWVALAIWGCEQPAEMAANDPAPAATDTQQGELRPIAAAGFSFTLPNILPVVGELTCGGGQCINGGYCDGCLCYTPKSPISKVMCGCDALSPACGVGKCDPAGGYCTGPFCDQLPQCFAPGHTISKIMCAGAPAPRDCDTLTSCGPGKCVGDSYCDGCACHAPDAPLSIAMCKCDLLAPKCGEGECLANGGYCDGPHCRDPKCYAPDSAVAQLMCQGAALDDQCKPIQNDCGPGQCIGDSFCDSCLCYAANHPYSQLFCGCGLANPQCGIGKCIDGVSYEVGPYCDSLPASYAADSLVYGVMCAGKPVPDDCGKPTDCGPGQCIGDSICDSCLCYAPDHPLSVAACQCKLIDPACGAGECLANGAFCEGPHCATPVCYSPDSELSQFLCQGGPKPKACDAPPDCGPGQCIGGGYCDSCLCYAPDHPISQLFCACELANPQCGIGECIPGVGYCEGPHCDFPVCYDASSLIYQVLCEGKPMPANCGNPTDCGPGKCVGDSYCDSCLCYAPDHELSVLMCQCDLLDPTCGAGECLANGAYCEGPHCGAPVCYLPTDPISVYMCQNGKKPAACSEACIDPPATMRAWWPLDESSGNTAAELVSGQDGTWVNGPTATAGKVAGALAFDGLNDVVTANTIGAHNYMNLTIDVWVRPENVSGDKSIVEFGLFLYELALEGDEVRFVWQPQPFSIARTTTGANIVPGQWVFLAVTIDQNGELRIYKDGALIDSFSYPDITGFWNGTMWTIGDGTSGPFKGAIDEVEVFERALSAAEIAALYNAGATGKCKPEVPTDCGAGSCVNGSYCDSCLCYTPDHPYSQLFCACELANPACGIGECIPGAGYCEGTHCDFPVCYDSTSLIYQVMCEGAPVPKDCGNTTDCGPGKCVGDSFCDACQCYAPTHQLSVLMCQCNLLDPACGAGECLDNGAYCEGSHCATPVCYVPSHPISVYMCQGGKLPPECSQTCIEPPPNMRAWWPFDETSGPTSAELISGQNGTWINGPTPTGGTVAGAIAFNGTTDLVRATPTGNHLYHNLSIDVWVRPATVTGNHTIVDYGGYKYELSLWGDEVTFVWQPDPVSFGYTTTTLNLVPGQWVFLAISVDQWGNLKIYKNGVLAETHFFGPVTGSHLGGDWEIGNGSSGPFKGAIDELEIFERILSAAEVAALYAAGPKGKCKPEIPVDCGPGQCIKGSYCDGCKCYAPEHPYSQLFCACDLADPACGIGECIPGVGYCEGTHCDFPVCYDASSIVYQVMCEGAAVPKDCGKPDCGPGQCVGTSFCDSCQCYAPDHPLSVAMCQCALLNPACGAGDCLPNGAYCEGSACPTPVCYSPTSPISVFMCQGGPKPPGCGLACTPPPPAMRAWWPFDEAVGTNANELIVGDDGVWQGGPTPVAGKVAGALGFDGINDRVVAPTSVAHTYHNLSIDVWVRPASFGASRTVVDYGSFKYALEIDGDEVTFVWQPQFLSFATTTTSMNLTLGEWVFLAVTVDQSGNLKFYKNGALVETRTWSPISGSWPGGGWIIGDGTSRFHGAIDELEIFERVLAPAEIAAIFNAGAAGKCKTTSSSPTNPTGGSTK
jgi:hypothetical protein